MIYRMGLEGQNISMETNTMVRLRMAFGMAKAVSLAERKSNFMRANGKMIN